MHMLTIMPPGDEEAWEQHSPNDQLNTNGKRASSKDHDEQPAKRLASDDPVSATQSSHLVGRYPPRHGALLTLPFLANSCINRTTRRIISKRKRERRLSPPRLRPHNRPAPKILPRLHDPKLPTSQLRPGNVKAHMVPRSRGKESRRSLLSNESEGSHGCENLQQWRTAKTRAAWV